EHSMTSESPGRIALADDRQERQAFAIGPTGAPMSLDDLPPPDTKRWVIRRKAEVVAGVRCGLISLEEACRRYSLSVEEFVSWQRLIEALGRRGLRTSRLQHYRRRDKVAQDRAAAE